MNATAAPQSPWAINRLARWSALGVNTAWAVFWVLFATLDATSEGWGPHPIGFILIVALLGAIPWRWPRAGGLLLLAGAAFGVLFFRGAPALLMLTLPAGVCGLVLATLRIRRTENGVR